MGFQVAGPVRAAPDTDVWDVLRYSLRAADGAVILALRQLRVDSGAWRPDTPAETTPTRWWPSPWSQVEAGMSIMMDIPTLVVCEEGVSGGALDPALAVDHVYGTGLGDPDDDLILRTWAVDIVSRRRDRLAGNPSADRLAVVHE
jgi:hypothetical protein